MELSERLAGARAADEVGSDRPFLLEGDRVWWVQAGRVDVFAVALAGGEAAGARRHLLRVEEGGLVLGTGAAGRAAAVGLLGVGGVGTRLVELDRAALRALAALPGCGAAACALVDGWVDALCASMARGVPSVECGYLPMGAESSPAEAACVRPDRRVAWVKHEDGESLLLGRAGLRVNGNGFTPVSDRTWLQVGPGSRIRVEPTDALLEGGDAWAGLDNLHALVLRHAAQDAEREADAERLRLRLKAQRSSGALAGSLSTLADTLDPAEHAAPGAGAGAGEHDPDPLLAACRRVGAAMALEVEPLPRSAAASPQRDPLATLARANRFRTRQVVLREGWWREDCGPLLAWSAEGRRPLALIPVRGPGYLLVDPERGEEAPVTAARAEEIDPLAHSFYRPFPDTALGIGDIVRFGLRGCRGEVATVLAMGIGGGLLSLVIPIATGMIFSDIIPEAGRSELVQLTAVLLALALANALFTITSGIALVRLESRMGAAVQAGVWDRLLSLPMTFFRGYAAGDLARRAMGIDAIRKVLSGATITALLGGLFSVFHFGLLFRYSPRLAGWATLLIAVAIAVTLGAGKMQVGWERRVTAIQNRLSGQVLQFLSSIAKLRVAAAETQAFALWAGQFGRQRQIQFRARSIADGLAAFHAGFPLAAMLVLYALAAPMLAGGAGGMRTGDFLAFMASFVICLTGMLSACTALVSAVMVVPLYEQARPILQSTPEVDTARTDPGVLSGEVEVQHLSFRYSPEGASVLRDLGLRIRAGEYVAFVGPSGSGKSTLMRLLLGLESPDAGAIYYDGQELAGLDIQAVRRQIGVVLQSGRLMSGDLFTNIAGSSSATLEEAWEAAAMAGFDEDIRKMPMGMHTVVSEGGGTLSGGQRQRLMIARAIVRKPRILLFDEATSALDNRTQAIVTASLDRLQATRVVIAHRLSTIINADRIYVVQNGRIVQQGAYAELMREGGLFAELAKRQLS